MTAYELDDEFVREFVAQSWIHPHAILMTGHLETQIPIPVPTKIGAVVRTDAPGYVWVRIGTEDELDCWADADDQEKRRLSGIGRIVEVLSEGVDL